MKLKITQKINTLAIALTLGTGVASAGTNAYAPQPAVMSVNEVTNLGNDETRIAELTGLLDQLDADLATATGLAQALEVTAQYQESLATIESSIQTMRTTLETAIQNNQVNSKYVLADLEATQGQMASILSQLSQMASRVFQSILYDLSMVTGSQMNSLISNLQSELNSWGVAEQFADRVNALLQKKQDAVDKYNNAMTAIAATNDILERLTLAQTAKTEIYAILTDIQTEVAAIETEAKNMDSVKQAINEAAYQRLSGEIADIEATYNTVYAEFMALAQINGSSWAASFGNKLGGIQSGINGMKGTLGSLYQQGELTEETTLASIYEQYDTIVGDLNGLKAQFEQTINGLVNQTLYSLNMITSSQMGSLIGNLQTQLNEWGVAEQFTDRVNALLQKKADAAQKVANAQAAIAATTDYVERLTTAKSAQNEVNTILGEIQEEIEAILNDAKAIDSVKQAINEAAYQRLSAEIADIEATYNTVYAEFMALAQINGSGWAASFGNKLGGIQSGINGMKGTLGSLYQQGELTEETTLASIYEQYDTIVGDLNGLKAQFEQTINGLVYQILYDLNMVTSNQMGSLISDLQTQLNELGKAEEYADRVNALWIMKRDAAQKVADAQAAIAATSNYVERLTLAQTAKTEVYAILNDMQTEINNILQITTGINSINYAERFANDRVYDLNGNRVASPVKGNLYIINGKKVVLK